MHKSPDICENGRSKMFYVKRDRKGGKKMVCYAGPDEFPVRKVKVRKVKVVCCYAGPTKFPVREVKSKKIKVKVVCYSGPVKFPVRCRNG